MPEVWDKVLAHRDSMGESGLAVKRAEQQLDFTWALVRDELEQRLRGSAAVRSVRDEIRADLLAGRLQATAAADRIIAAFDTGTAPTD